MDNRKHRTAKVTSCAAAALGVLAASATQAQQAPAQQSPAPTPAPSPSPTRSPPPNVMYLPNVVPERFSIGGTPSPTPTPVPVPPPVVDATPQARTAPAERAAGQNRRTVPQARTAEPAPAPTAAATPPGATSGEPALPQSAPAPAPLPQQAPVAVPAAPPAAATPGWLWALGGAGGMALLFAAFWALRRRRRAPHAAFETPPDPVAVPEPPLRAAPPGIAPRPRPPAPHAAAAPPISSASSSDPFELVVRPLHLEMNAEEVLLEIELLIGNLQPGAAEAIRASLALISANPDQDRHVAGFHANPVADPAGRAFDLAAGAGGRMPARLRVRREHLHVVQVGGRPMFVPLVMVDLRWRAGLSVRRFGADFMIGTAGQGAKLGPIWLDRAQLSAPLAATRYFPKQAPVAA